ncbi:MAG TPA: SRPBCC family protein [Chryseolinea sp.]|nr:SRPBCC family protein [Chryseolinea sp.]
MKKTTIIAEPGKQELFIIREFDAPRELVFKAYTDPKLLIKWMGPKDLTMKIDKMSTKSGGSYRYIHSDAKGNEFGFRGVIHEVEKPERIIQTFEFEGMPEKGHVTLDTARFEALPGNRTKVIGQSVFQSVADRDGMIKSGMERGVLDSHERLDALLAQGI